MHQDIAVSSRREFLKSSTGLAVRATLLGTMAVPRAVHAGASQSLRVGLIGCGARGTAAAQNALRAHSENVLVAVGDAFVDFAQGSVNKLRRDDGVKNQVKVDPDRVFVGFDAYKRVIDSGIDVVLLAEPPHFRPQHLAYAVGKGKHAFVEKPIAVDAPGVRSVIDTCSKAEADGLSIVSGLCWRYHPAVQETVRRITEDKAIGDVISIESCYNGGTLWHRGDEPEWSRMEYQIRNWIYFSWLSGDHITEQAVHSLDKSAWVQGDVHPVKAFGTGGRQQRTGRDFGDIYDHHTVFYEYPSGIRVNFMCRQQKDCTDYIDEVVRGTKGQARILANVIEGENPWNFDTKAAKKVDMYDLEHVALFHSIREGQPINNGHYMANSTMIAIMGRMCTYSGKGLTWDECFNNDQHLGPTEYAWTDNAPEVRVPIPGKAS